MEKIRKVFVGKTVETTAGKPIVAVVSTEDVDFMGDVIYQGATDKGAGWRLDDFNSRGRIYWMHNPFVPNLAKASARVDGKQLMLSVQFDLKDKFAAELDRKYREGFLSEWSVGFWPTKAEDNEHGGKNFYEQDLLEVSAVNQGANPGTRTIDKAYADYIVAADEVRLALDGFESRLREIEAAIMRGETEREREKARALLNEIHQIRTGV